MEKLKEYKYIILIGLIILGFAFYWYELRPTQIRKKCFSESLLKPITGGVKKLQSDYYDDCLMMFGLK